MIQLAKIKSTGQVVQVVGPGDKGYTIVVEQFENPSRSGNRGSVFPVKNENLQIETHQVQIVS